MTTTVYGRVAHAKINLALHVTAQRENGFHLLDSLVCFADIGDRLNVSARNDAGQLVNLNLKGPFAPDLGDPQDNLIVEAACLLAERLENAGVSCSPVDITLEKNLPVASGIGGGSADAAAVLMLLRQIWTGAQLMDLHELARKLGSDVPMCLDNQPKRVGGYGERISPFNLTVALPLLLVNPGVQLSTSKVFDALGNTQQSPIALNSTLTPDKIKAAIELLSPLRNDLQQPAISLVPEISEVISQIKKQPGCILVRMSGSGATCFGIFENHASAENAMTEIKNSRGHWWAMACKSIINKGTENG